MIICLLFTSLYIGIGFPTFSQVESSGIGVGATSLNYRPPGGLDLASLQAQDPF